MADIVLSTIDLDVFGGPSVVDVSVDFGQTGTRGTRVWIGQGDPAGVLGEQDVLLYDLFINTNPIDSFYGWLYQYVLEVGNPTWVRVLRLNPSQYSSIEEVTFTAGSGTVAIPIALLTSDSGSVATQYRIRYSIEGSNPVASGFTYTVDASNINITLNASELSGGTWTGLGDTRNVHFFISYLS